MSINALLIEDDSDLAEAIADYMELDGFEFDFAYNGSAGLNLALEGRYDIILTDINMPKMDGLDVCQSLRKQGVTTPILMLTARDTLEDKIAGFEVGSDDYLVKPFAMEELKVRLMALVRRAQGSVTSLSVANLKLDLDKHQAVRDSKLLIGKHLITMQFMNTTSFRRTASQVSTSTQPSIRYQVATKRYTSFLNMMKRFT
ncbi:response regulator [Vibrio splendidus]|nr:response regulator [Vibrio splendidus]UOE82471.1 response regulator [Vibrio splendidus]